MEYCFGYEHPENDLSRLGLIGSIVPRRPRRLKGLAESIVLHGAAKP